MTDSSFPAPAPATAWRGILLICLSTALFAALDTLSKYMIGAYHPVQVTWGRQFFSVLILFVVVPWREFVPSLRTARPLLQTVRAALLVVVTLSFTIALGSLPLADATTIAFMTPLMVTALGSLFMGEHVGMRRWSAVVAGFVGVVIVARPTAAGFSPAALLVFALAAANAVFLLVTRMIGHFDTANTTMVLTTLLSAAAMTLAAPFYWAPLSLAGWAQMVAQGVLTGVAQYLVIVAYRSTSLSTLAPFSYFQIVWVAILGFIVFDEVPVWSTLLGGAIIVASGVYMFLRESQLRREAIRTEAGRASDQR